MKNGKLLILLVLILSLTVFLFACGEDAEQPDDTGSDTVADTTADSAGQEEEQEQVKHEIHDYFVLEYDPDGYDLSKVAQYEGEVVDYDDEHHLLALKTQDLDTKNQVIDTIAVYDLTTGEKIHEQSVANLLYGKKEDRIELELEISYPVIQVIKESQSEDGDDIFDVTYYFAKKDGAVIRSTDKTSFDRWDYGNGLVAFDMGDDIVWVDRNMSEVRSIKSIAANGYDIDSFESEYQGYLYNLEYNRVQVFNRLGVCSGQYLVNEDSALNSFVLDNGNVLIQEVKMVDAGEPFDLLSGGMYLQYNSYVMNYLDGKMTPIDLEFVVQSLETAYSLRYSESDYSYLPFELASGHDNQAIITRYANGMVSHYQEYVVLTNDLEIEYTVKNTTEGLNWDGACALSSEIYWAEVAESGYFQGYLFDLDGNAISPISTDDMYVTEEYIVSPNAVYDHKMNLLYDLSDGKFDDVEVDEESGNVYLWKHNFETGGDEAYLLDVAAKTTKMIADGIEKSLTSVSNGFYVMHDLDNDRFTFYNTEDEILLVVYHDYDTMSFEDMYIVEAEFEGDPVTYVIQ